MALYPTLFGHVDLPRPEPLRRADDRYVAKEAWVRVRREEASSGDARRAARSEA